MNVNDMNVEQLKALLAAKQAEEAKQAAEKQAALSDRLCRAIAAEIEQAREDGFNPSFKGFTFTVDADGCVTVQPITAAPAAQGAKRAPTVKVDLPAGSSYDHRTGEYKLLSLGSAGFKVGRTDGQAVHADLVGTSFDFANTFSSTSAASDAAAADNRLRTGQWILQDGAWYQVIPGADPKLGQKPSTSGPREWKLG